MSQLLMEELCQFGRSTRAPPCFLKVDAANRIPMTSLMLLWNFIITGDMPDL